MMMMMIIIIIIYGLAEYLGGELWCDFLSLKVQ